jgi:hypothetical protein
LYVFTGPVVDQWKRTWFRGVLAGLEALGKVLPFFRSSGTRKVLVGLEALGKILPFFRRSGTRKVLAGLETLGKILTFFRNSGTTIDLGLVKLWQDWKMLGKSCHSSGVQVQLLT